MTVDRLLKLAVWLGPVNFLIFIIADLLIGGDALSGKVERGRYYLNQHGSLTEVNHAVFVYSAIHAYSVLFGLVLAIAAAGMLKRKKQN